MKTKDLLTITTAAVASATLTVATFIAAPLEAGDEANPPPTIATPKLTVNGIELSLVPADGRQFKAGDKPEFELRAVNTLDRTATADLHLAMSGTAPANPMSRVLAIPTLLWEQDPSMTLGPKETRTLRLAASNVLSAGQMISVSLSQADPSGKSAAANRLIGGMEVGSPVSGSASIVALQFSTVLPLAAPVPAAPVKS